MDKIDLIRQLLEQDGKNANAWYLLGLEYCELADYSQAFQAFSEALKCGNEELKDKIIVELGQLSDKSRLPAQDSRQDNDPCSKKTDPYASETEQDMISNDDSDNLIKLTLIEGNQNNVVNINYKESANVCFQDVGGLDQLKNIISMKIIKPFKNPDLFERFQKKVGGGILLFGPPGCGKTYIAKATAGECNARFISVSITDILDPYLGVSSQNVKDIFSNARAKKPCILFFDEIDTLGYNRSKLLSEHMRPIIDQLLSEIEGIDSNTEQLLVIGATNMPWDVDPALKRPGRFDKNIFVPPPDEEARVSIFKLKLKGKPTEIIDYELLAKQTELYSGADIENVVEVATENVINKILSSDCDDLISMKDLMDAIANTKPSTIEWLRTIKNYVKYANQAGLYDDVEKFILSHKKILG